jgi:Nitrogen regulatory protein PII
MESGVLDTGLYFYGGVNMKKLEIVVSTEKLEDLKEALYLSGVKDMLLSGIMGDNSHKNRKVPYFKAGAAPVFLHKFRIEVTVSDSMVAGIMNAVMGVIKIGNQWDGSISICRVNDEVEVMNKAEIAFNR